MTGVTLVSNLADGYPIRSIHDCRCGAKLQHRLALLVRQPQKFHSMQQSLPVTNNAAHLKQVPGRQLHLECDHLTLRYFRDEDCPESTFSEIAGSPVNFVIALRPKHSRL